jgi:hypothetical protein
VKTKTNPKNAAFQGLNLLSEEAAVILNKEF